MNPQESGSISLYKQGKEKSKMRIKNSITGLLAAALFSGTIVAPLTAEAQRGRDNDNQERRDRDYRDQRDRDRDDQSRNNRDRNRDRDYRNRDERNNRNDRNWQNRDRQDWRNGNSRDWRHRESDRRQQTKNEWRNIAIGAGAVGVLGLLKKDNTLMFAGAAGALYSLNRYEQDRRSQSQLERTRSEYFSRPYFTRDGQRFERRTVTRNGQKYYQFYRH